MPLRVMAACLAQGALYFLLVLLSVQGSASDLVLARVEVSGDVRSFSLPAQALFRDAQGHDYLLVLANRENLESAGWKWKGLAGEAMAGDFQVATPLRPGSADTIRGSITPILDDGLRWIVRASPERVSALVAAGFAVHRLGPEPLDLKSMPPPVLDGIEHLAKGLKSLPDPLVSAMIASVESTNLWWLIRRLTGEDALIAGNEPALITSRVTSTNSPLREALEFTFERFQGLGLTPRYHSWVSGTFSNLNVVATLPGTVRSNELVLVIAHLDDVPQTGLAPGADDNATGSAALLTAAGIFAGHRFERTIQFILFTGEEPGLLGSAVYAAGARSAGDNIVAVLNLDMLGWDSIAPASLQLHTRTPAHPMYSNDLAIVTAFTNTVETYGLRPGIVPVHKASGLDASDHSSFWNRNYAAVLCIEDYQVDFTPWYHTSKDKISTLNFKYLTAAVKAAVATTAHLAMLIDRTPSDALQVVASNWRYTNPLGSRVVLLKHAPGALETVLDPLDLAVTNAPAITNAWSLGAFSSAFGYELVNDARPWSSETVFRVQLTASERNGGLLSSSNALQIEFLTPAAPERVYNARVIIDPVYAADQEPFECVTNLVQLARSGNRLTLPALTNVPPGQAYGTCEIDCRFVDRSRARCRLELVQLSGSTIHLASDAQAGCRIVDSIEWSSTLASNSWQTAAVFTNDVTPDSASFDSGWKGVQYQVDTSLLPGAQSRYLRLGRVWLTR